jgi:hypothetical protein
MYSGSRTQGDGGGSERSDMQVEFGLDVDMKSDFEDECVSSGDTILVTQKNEWHRAGPSRRTYRAVTPALDLRLRSVIESPAAAMVGEREVQMEVGKIDGPLVSDQQGLSFEHLIHQQR